MKRYYLIPLMAVVITVIGCSQGTFGPEGFGDDQLIMSIQAANDKIDISFGELPSSSQEVLSSEFNEYFAVDTKMAPRLGYVVSMGGNANNFGESSEVYFGTNGRRLMSRRGHGMKGGRNFDFVYPITYNMPDGTTITVEDREGMSAMKAWREANPDNTERPTLQFPVDVVVDDVTITINNEEEMKALYRESFGHKGRRLKVDFVFPITFIMPDGTTINIESKEGMSAVKDWHDANPDAKQRGSLQFPVSIIFEGETITFNSREEMKAFHLANSKLGK